MVDSQANAPTDAALTLGITPTPDAAFALHALIQGSMAGSSASAASTTGSIEPTLAFTPSWHDIGTLDDLAQSGTLDVTLLSAPAYALVQDRYTLLPCGAKFGNGYGAMIVTRNPLMTTPLPQISVAVPGLLTSGFMALSLFLPQTFTYTLLRYDKIAEAVLRDEAQAGLLIAEDQLTHQRLGLYTLVDLGAWWQEQTGLPLPLEVLAVRRDLAAGRQAEIAQAVQASLRHGLANRAPTLEAVMSYAHGMDQETANTYIGMYVGDSMLDLDNTHQRSLETFLERCALKGLLPPMQRRNV